jgi:serine/threonine protein kinase
MSQASVRRQPSSRRPQPTYKYGDRLDERYIINGFAGKGATSFVYRARSLESFEPVAIKVLHPHLLKDEVKRARFLREAQMMMQLVHPNVVTFHEIIERDGLLAFVMEYIDGETLADWQRGHDGGLEEVELACVFVDILRGLSHAHRAGIVHRDLKPANVLITHRDGRYVAKIIDFGVARQMSEPMRDDEKSKILGTAAYISPEEVSNPEQICPASDIYSIGVMLYEAACGRRPFQGMPVRDLMQAHVAEQPPRPSDFNPGMTPAFESVILRTLQKQPEGRFDSAPEMIRGLELALQGAMAMSEEEWAEVESSEEEMTVEWHRAIERVAARQANPMLSFMRRCVQSAFLLFASTGSHHANYDPHYIHRQGPDMPLM